MWNVFACNKNKTASNARISNVLARISTVLILSVAAFSVLAADAAYHLTRVIKLDGDGSWDYLYADSASRRLYVSHFSTVAVLDMDTGKVVGEISGLDGVHGVAIVPEAGIGYASNGRGASISIFDLDSLAVTGRIPAGNNPDAIIYDPVSGHVFAFNHGGGDVTVIDAATGKTDGRIEIGGQLEYAVADGEGAIFVNVEDRNEIVQFDSRSFEIESRWSLGHCDAPTGIAMDKESRRLFSACGNNMLVVVDAESGQIVKEVPIGGGSDGVRFDPEKSLIFTSNGAGSLTIIREIGADNYEVVANIPTRRGARTLEIDLATHNIFTATADLGSPPEAVNGERKRSPIMPDSFVVLEYAP
jgi:DNA-binding beta-propeller fold protein YncE